MRFFEEDSLPENQNDSDLVEIYKEWSKSKKYKRT